MEHPLQQGFIKERLSFDYRVVMDVQFIMIMTIFEWKSGIRLTFDPDVGFWKLKKGKSSEFRWESIFEGKKIQKN